MLENFVTNPQGKIWQTRWDKGDNSFPQVMGRWVSRIQYLSGRWIRTRHDNYLFIKLPEVKYPRIYSTKIGLFFSPPPFTQRPHSFILIVFD